MKNIAMRIFSASFSLAVIFALAVTPLAAEEASLKSFFEPLFQGRKQLDKPLERPGDRPVLPPLQGDRSSEEVTILPLSDQAILLQPSQAIVFRSESEAFSVGMRSYNAGDKTGAAQALGYAAEKGYPRAMWKLGRMYADGDGVEPDPLKAFEYFSKIANDHADEAPGSPNARFVANAFVILGRYFQDGIPGTYVKANPAKARQIFVYAASYFGDRTAQYHLGKLYLDGMGVDRDALSAARWLNLSAEKGHSGAQALLGRMLIRGEGVPRQSARGLMWLKTASELGGAEKEPWIGEWYEKAYAEATETDRQAALAFAAQRPGHKK